MLYLYVYTCEYNSFGPSKFLSLLHCCCTVDFLLHVLELTVSFFVLFILSSTISLLFECADITHIASDLLMSVFVTGELKVGYSPIGFVRCGRSACKVTKLDWKVGKETGGKKLEDPHSLKSNEMAQMVFAPCQPLVVDSFKNCEGLSRIAFLDGNTAVMLGKVVKVTHK